LTTVCRY